VESHHCSQNSALIVEMSLHLIELAEIVEVNAESKFLGDSKFEVKLDVRFLA